MRWTNLRSSAQEPDSSDLLGHIIYKRTGAGKSFGHAPIIEIIV